METENTETARGGLTKVLLAAALLLVGWNIYKGATVCEVGIPGFTVKFGCQSPSDPSNFLNGSWQYEMHSSVTGNPYSGTLDLTVSGDRVSGMMDSPDKKEEKTAVEGTFVNGSLKLLRTTNQDGVMQEYHLQRQGDHLVGTFENVGQTSQRYKDNGTLQLNPFR